MIQERFRNLGVGWAEILGVATSFLLVTGMSYFYGYYYLGLNAEWIINLLTTKELLLSNIKLGAGIVMALMILESFFTNHSKVPRFFALSGSCLILLFIMIKSMIQGEVWIEILSYLIGILAIYGLVYCKYLGKIMSLLFLIFVVPCLNGITAYEKKIRSSLPEVTLKDDKKKWYLFDSYSDQAIVIDSISKSKNIRIVPINDIVNIKVK